MDLNRSYFDHQRALMRAASADDRQSRAVHQAHADAFARGIEVFQRDAGAAAATSWRRRSGVAALDGFDNQPAECGL
ncbi:hypothetical protein GCM10011494_24130 [Novosphingobium endophyticum]|uniref:Uncharacterized protein n=1 Tax=Novosphingobium endophyticum TaxID=1955250 RepID=A0A916X601_9SPHN|nr:hypothetical protein [Novosphingobium endophyticum]GGC04787.1 hypothetical protein GCM10011494_24130 [Novosphingobium endophyticum]